MNENFKLPKGITGFTSIDNYFEIPSIEVNLIRKAVNNLIQSNFNLVESGIYEPSDDNNFYTLILVNTRENFKYHILFNAHYPYFGRLKKKIDWTERIYGDLPDDMIANFENYGFNYLSKEVLDSEAKSENLVLLAKSEKSQISYWKSKTFGEIIFNNYD